MFYCDFCKISKNTFFRSRLNVGWYKSRHNSKTTHNYNSVTCLRRLVWTITLRGIIPSQSEKEKKKTKKPWKTIVWFIVYSKSVIIHLTLKKKDRKRTFGWRKFYYYTRFFTRTHFIRTSKLRLGKNKNKLKTRWSPDNARKSIYHIYIYIYMFREIL